MIKFKELLFLTNIKRVGKTTIYKKYWDLLNESEDIGDLYSKMLNQSNLDKDKLDDALKKASKVYDLVNDSEIEVITVFDENYPKKLMDMGNKRPLILYVKGNVDALNKPSIAVIGTRKPSNQSKSFEQSLVKAVLDNTDKSVVSGLALGCDKIAHKTTVDENKTTIAFLPSGVNVITPPSNKNLAEKIIENGGCLVSEYEPNKGANKGSYVDRDKIVAAFSDITFVVECSAKSGTMHTVNAVLDYKKDNSQYKRELYAYLPDEEFDGDFGGNKIIINNEFGTRVDDIGAFCEELAILGDFNKEIDEKLELKDSNDEVKEKPKVKLDDFNNEVKEKPKVKKTGQTTLDF